MDHLTTFKNGGKHEKNIIDHQYPAYLPVGCTGFCT
jgi:hypothetical protein